MKNGVKSEREQEVPMKNPGKLPKMAFTGTFEYHGGEKNSGLEGGGD